MKDVLSVYSTTEGMKAHVTRNEKSLATQKWNVFWRSKIVTCYLRGNLILAISR
jgi:hypothetical protein